MPVLNVRELTDPQLKMLSQTFDAVSGLELLPLAQLDKDEVRIRVDETLAKVLGLPSFSPIRELLAREPGLSALEINPSEAATEEAVEESLQGEML